MPSDFASQQLHLIPDPAAAPRPGHADSGSGFSFSSLLVPSGISYLLLPVGASPSITNIQPESSAAWITLETLQRSQPSLLIVTPLETRARINGQVAHRIAVLKERDQLQLDADWIFHVTIFNQSRVSVHTADRLGRPCAICRVPLKADAKAYSCVCGKVYHCEEKDSGGLECARLLSECSCGRAVVLKEGFTYLPT